MSTPVPSAPEIAERFEALYEETCGKLYTYCRRLLGNGHGAVDDVFQQSYMTMLDLMRSGAPIDQHAAYLFRVARNHCYNILRRETGLPLDSVDAMPTPPDPYEHRELLDLIYTAMDRLPDDARELLLLREQLGMSYDEITSITGIHAEVARQRVSRAKRRLRDLLAPYIEDLERGGARHG